MIRSMTGYGSAKGSCQGLNISVELKSVNNRYLDCSVRLPRGFLFAEDAVKSSVQAHVSRGKVDVFVSVDSTGSDAVIVKVNEQLAASYVSAVRQLSQEFGLEDSLTAVALARMPDVLALEKQDADAEAVTAAIREITERALQAYDEMRVREGNKLREDISARLETIDSYVSEVERRSPETVREYRERLYRKMTEVLQNTALDEQRILLEAGIFADKVAVDEETVRLRSHIAQMRSMLSDGSPIGRKMDFLVQEFNRESNTIGSKCNDSAVTKIVIELKSEIEKIREQIQNIE
jgi:uncharacterized protein (TIGR00255 family)